MMSKTDVFSITRMLNKPDTVKVIEIDGMYKGRKTYH